MQLTQALEKGHTRHFHGNIYIHRAEGYIEIYGVIEWAPAYVDNHNVPIAAIPYTQVTVNPIMVLPYKIPMDKEPTKTYDPADTTPDTLFAKNNTALNMATLIYNIVTDNTSNMATL